MPDNITVTSTTGAGQALTAQVFNNVTSMTFDVARGVLFISYSEGNNPRTIDVSLSSVTTVTYTISAGVATVVVS